MAKHVWGDKETEFFYELSPERILDAIECLGYTTTGRCLTCNSMENRVYEVEIVPENEDTENPSDHFVIAKFYRPGRWTQQQIIEEHQFLIDLHNQELPVIAPIPIAGETLFKLNEENIWYALFPKRGGRAPDEMDDEQLAQMGRLLARIHAVGKTREASHRLTLNTTTYGIQNLDYLLNNQSIPTHLESNYKQLVEQVCELSAPLFEGITYQRVHGDCHIGNVLWGRDGLQVFDFDDMVYGPPVQDIWLVIPGRDQDAQRQRNVLLDAYEMMLDFDWTSLRLTEPLRALRYIHFSAWIAKRWEDPAFKMAFPYFGTENYWQTQINDLREQVCYIQEATNSNYSFNS